MADTFADRLEVHRHDDAVTVYEQVTYCAWREGVTVYRGGEEIARHDDVYDTRAKRLAAV